MRRREEPLQRRKVNKMGGLKRHLCFNGMITKQNVGTLLTAPSLSPSTILYFESAESQGSDDWEQLSAGEKSPRKSSSKEVLTNIT